MITKRLSQKGLVHMQGMPMLPSYETIHGSRAYGLVKEGADYDVLGFCVPYMDDVFPHIKGKIRGFGPRHTGFQQYVHHHIKDDEGKEYDLTIYSIIKFFNLASQGNPNIIELMFTPDHCVTHMDRVGTLVRGKASRFLSKECYKPFLGYAFGQLMKAEKGVDPDKVQKKMYHAVRLSLQLEEILREGTLTLDKHVETLTDIRAGNWDLDEALHWCRDRKPMLKRLMDESNAVPDKPDMEYLRYRLLMCLEIMWGELPDDTRRVYDRLSTTYQWT